jgi:dTDP-4-amino-4,6-dideoxygalactose transaminase
MEYYSKKYGLTGNEFPTSLSWGGGTLSIPLFPKITAPEQDYIINILVNNINKMIGESK